MKIEIEEISKENLEVYIVDGKLNRGTESFELELEVKSDYGINGEFNCYLHDVYYMHLKGI